MHLLCRAICKLDCPSEWNFAGRVNHTIVLLDTGVSHGIVIGSPHFWILILQSYPQPLSLILDEIMALKFKVSGRREEFTRFLHHKSNQIILANCCQNLLIILVIRDWYGIFVDCWYMLLYVHTSLTTVQVKKTSSARRLPSRVGLRPHIVSSITFLASRVLTEASKAKLSYYGT